MAEWVYEAGIGENRAALIEDGKITEAVVEVESDEPKAGAIVNALLRPARIVDLDRGGQALLDAPPRRPEGSRIRVQVTREPLSELGKPKRAKARTVADDVPLRDAPTLIERIGPVRLLGLRDADVLEAAGWSELLEQAASGVVAFGANTLQIGLTPAMTLIDIDGHADVELLVIEGAQAAGAAIRCFGISGNIGIDFPTVEDRALRQRAAKIVREGIACQHEATSINGFGFMQIVRPRLRASLLEQCQYVPAGSAARAVMRRAQRSGLIGGTRLTAHSRVVEVIGSNPAWIKQMSRELGGPVVLAVDDLLPLGAGRIDAV